MIRPRSFPASQWIAFPVVLAFLVLAIPAVGQPVQTATAIMSPFSNKCIDVAGGFITDGTKAILYDCFNPPNQRFTLKPYNGAFQIVASHSGKCLNVSGAFRTNAFVVQTTCDGANTFLWSVQPRGESFQIKNRSSGRCIEVLNSSTANETSIIQGMCDGSPNELFTFPAPVVDLNLTAQYSGKCLSVVDGSTAEGKQVVQSSCQGLPSQAWHLVQQGGSFQIVAQNSGKCANIEGSSKVDLANVIQSTCIGSSSQLFDLRLSGVNYSLVNKNSGKCLDVNGASADGAAVVQSRCLAVPNQSFWVAPAGAISPGSLGLWSNKIILPVIPIAVANLPNGKLLMWSAYDRFAFGDDHMQTYTAVYDPATNAAPQYFITQTNHDMFCPGITHLPDGRILVSGGSSAAKTSIYNPFNNTWQTDQLMNIPRAYQGNALLPNGDVFTIGGSWAGGLGGKDGEVWNALTGWRKTSNISAETIVGPDPKGIYRADNQAWLFTRADGSIFHAGPSSQLNIFTTDGNGTATSAGTRLDDPYSMNGNAVMYDVGKILKVGGAPAYEEAAATARAFLIDINNGVKVEAVTPMANARAFSNSVVLPNGEVLVVGGQNYAIPFTDTTSVLAPELFNPVTKRFTVLAPMSIPRNYHSTSILLPDGRVFSGGGGQCGPQCAENHFDGQIFTPPYLVDSSNNPRLRPVISSVNATATWGQDIAVTADSGIASFALMRMSAITHTVSNDQRRIPLTFTVTGANTYSLSIPPSHGVVLPGYYMLFALNSAGVPSVSKNIKIE